MLGPNAFPASRLSRAQRGDQEVVDDGPHVGARPEARQDPGIIVVASGDDVRPEVIGEFEVGVPQPVQALAQSRAGRALRCRPAA